MKREKALEDKVISLEKLVVRLEEKLELLAQENYGIEATDYSTFDKFHQLVRSDSLERKCDQCNARNKARLDKHTEPNHVHKC